MVNRDSGARRTGDALRLVVGLALAATVLGGCASPALRKAEAGSAAEHALGVAGFTKVEVSGIKSSTVDVPTAPGQPSSDAERGVWLVTVDVDGAAWDLGIDRHNGAVVRTFEPDRALSRSEAAALAAARYNPRADDARRAQRTRVVVAALLALVVLYLVLRTMRIRHEGR